jgi:hypothetical protein
MHWVIETMTGREIYLRRQMVTENGLPKRMGFVMLTDFGMPILMLRD